MLAIEFAGSSGSGKSTGHEPRACDTPCCARKLALCRALREGDCEPSKRDADRLVPDRKSNQPATPGLCAYRDLLLPRCGSLTA